MNWFEAQTFCSDVQIQQKSSTLRLYKDVAEALLGLDAFDNSSEYWTELSSLQLTTGYFTSLQFSIAHQTFKAHSGTHHGRMGIHSCETQLACEQEEQRLTRLRSTHPIATWKLVIYAIMQRAIRTWVKLMIGCLDQNE